MMERRNYSRILRGILTELAYAAVLVFMGAVVGVSLCKLWPEFWYFVNWGIGA